MLHDVTQRTTLTLEDDVASLLRDEARRTGKPLKAVVNEALRRGLEERPRRRRTFRVQARDMGMLPGIEIDDVHGLIDRLEGPFGR